ncbi:zinc-ribbon domain-containing protein [Candidatus Paracaedibacter symbiosus]|uniref:zinc-ribbon domain-containing protein n=1 Tax=Candidatus Paracaedibacter symbiosus TaxID=244582 RepID=UPI003B967D68
MKNGELMPFDVVPGSDQKVWWRCHKDHEWEAMISYRALSAVGCLKCYQASTLLKKSGKI